MGIVFDVLPGFFVLFFSPIKSEFWALIEVINMHTASFQAVESFSRTAKAAAAF